MRASTSGRNSRALPLVAAVGAVTMWALTPALVSLAGHHAGHNELFLTASAAATAASVVLAVRERRSVRAAWSADAGGVRGGIGWACVSGVFLGVWYYGFYRALMTGPPVPVTVIAFTWPLIAVAAVAVFTPAQAPDVTRRDVACMVVAFVAAAYVAASTAATSLGQHASVWAAYGWAALAALGSGFYLPFALRSAARFGRCAPHGSSVAITVATISVANVASAVTGALLMLAQGERLSWTRFSAATWVWCAMIGVGVYLAAEVAWTWGHARNTSKSLSALPFLTPAASTLLLAGFFDATVTWQCVVGLVVVLAANLVILAGRGS